MFKPASEDIICGHGAEFHTGAKGRGPKKTIESVIMIIPGKGGGGPGGGNTPS